MNMVGFAFSIKLQALGEWAGVLMIYTSDPSRSLNGKLFDERRK
jgi:hypothetical protein